MMEARYYLMCLLLLAGWIITGHYREMESYSPAYLLGVHHVFMWNITTRPVNTIMKLVPNSQCYLFFVGQLRATSWSSTLKYLTLWVTENCLNGPLVLVSMRQDHLIREGSAASAFRSFKDSASELGHSLKSCQVPEETVLTDTWQAIPTQQPEQIQAMPKNEWSALKVYRLKLEPDQYISMAMILAHHRYIGITLVNKQQDISVQKCKDIVCLI